MKKLIIMLALVVAGFVASSWSGGYSIPCYACREATQTYAKGYSYCLGCPCWRSYRDEGTDSKYQGYMIYRCQHGHILLIPKTSDIHSHDLSEVLVVGKDGPRHLNIK